MRQQCHLIKIQKGLYTYVNKSDDPARTKRRNDRKKADAAYIAKLVKAQAT